MSGPERDNAGLNELSGGELAENTALEKDFAESKVVKEMSIDELVENSSEEEAAMQLPETVPQSKFPELAVEAFGAEFEEGDLLEADLESDLAEVEESASADDGDQKVMSVIDHLDELRTRLVRSLFVFAFAMSISFYFGRDIIRILELPAKGMQFQALSIEEPVLVYLKVSFYGALALAAPFLLYEISAFIAPGLRRNERRVLAPVVLGGPLLFVAGAVFCYFLVLPPMLSFFNSFSGPIAPVQQRLDYYISLVTTLIFYMGLCFQLPIVLFALALAGIVNSRQLLSFWRYALLASSIVAAIITPDPTVVSMLIVMLALVGLYFMTIGLLRLFGR